ncbi:TA0938 family protein [Caldivirga maquilingensis]|uniref:Uncharacterized protein n=1 Tax=Caldivirga maquilingensis (strain ATCC 700844 / DSM 13496 / JCM 10307 / IC-167) TaxID=397948 RepID=A8MCC5_CALMQ|nr:TA0938 family protein [Caldivirga maquilingensis]ABW01431.1 conserved hypothetical protein [Caldivirga maquilingensis IC-167]
MIIEVNGRQVGTKETGCALCGATWGEYYDEVDGEKLFFCCDLCAKGFKNIINEIKRRTGWSRIDKLTMVGNYYKGRTGVAMHGNEQFKFYVKFNDDADITIFNEL